MTERDATIPATPDAAVKMDRMYRYTRHVYDLSRKYYLLGRDRLLREMDVRDGDRVLEVGCGTARNLVRLGRLRPHCQLYGLDASAKMLETARHCVDRAGVGDRVTLRPCLAEQLDPKTTFDLDERFDVVFFSYALSMIPTWREAIEAAMAALKPDRTLYIVDFWDQAELPAWFRRVLQTWLSWFHVQHRPEMLAFLEQQRDAGRWDVAIEPIAGRYAVLCRVSPPAHADTG